jgi:AraC-like DNA-binding protein
LEKSIPLDEGFSRVHAGVEAWRDVTVAVLRDLAEHANPRQAGLLFYVVSAGKNVGEALALLTRYSRIVNEAVRAKLLRAPEGMVVEIDLVGLPRHGARQATEFSVAITVKVLREVAGRLVRPTYLTFVHGRNAKLREFERFFGCPVEFAAPSDQLVFSTETLALPLVAEDPYLLQTLQPFCDEAARQRNTATGTLRAAVENEVQKLLPHGKAKKQIVAAKLAMSTRTLSRKLKDESTSYEQVLDQLRRTLALQYIKDPGIPLSQVAWLLGYEGSTSFNHAFKRWTGRSPSVARKQKRFHTPK